MYPIRRTYSHPHPSSSNPILILTTQNLRVPKIPLPLPSYPSEKHMRIHTKRRMYVCMYVYKKERSPPLSHIHIHSHPILTGPSRVFIDVRVPSIIHCVLPLSIMEVQLPRYPPSRPPLLNRSGTPFHLMHSMAPSDAKKNCKFASHARQKRGFGSPNISPTQAPSPAPKHHPSKEKKRRTTTTPWTPPALQRGKSKRVIGNRKGKRRPKHFPSLHTLQ
jgi:hypothetical protein